MMYVHVWAKPWHQAFITSQFALRSLPCSQIADQWRGGHDISLHPLFHRAKPDSDLTKPLTLQSDPP